MAFPGKEPSQREITLRHVLVDFFAEEFLDEWSLSVVPEAKIESIIWRLDRGNIVQFDFGGTCRVMIDTNGDTIIWGSDEEKDYERLTQALEEALKKALI